MDCLGRIAEFLNKYDLPEALIQAFRDDCDNLNDCFNSYCFPIISTPKDNNKFLSFLKEGEKETCDLVEEGWEENLCSYLLKESEKVAEIYFSQGKYNKLLDLFYFNPSLASKYPEIGYLRPSIILNANNVKYNLITLLYSRPEWKGYVELDKDSAEILVQLIELIYKYKKGLYHGMSILPLQFYDMLPSLSLYPEIAKKVDYIIEDILSRYLPEEDMLKTADVSAHVEQLCAYFISLASAFEDMKYVEDFFFVWTNFAKAYPYEECIDNFVNRVPKKLLEKIKVESLQRRHAVTYLKKLYEKHPNLAKKYLDDYVEEMLDDCRFLIAHPELIDSVPKDKIGKILANCSGENSPTLRKLTMNYLDLIFKYDKTSFCSLLSLVIDKLSDEEIINYMKEVDNNRSCLLTLSRYRKHLAIKYLDKMINIKCALCIENLLPEYENEIKKRRNELEDLLYTPEVNAAPLLFDNLIKLTLPENPKEITTAIVYGYLKFRPDLASKYTNEINKFKGSLSRSSLSYTPTSTVQQQPSPNNVEEIIKNPELVYEADLKFLIENLEKLANNEKS